MNKNIQKTIIVAAIITVILVISRIDCILFKIQGIPDSMSSKKSQGEKWFFLYSVNICQTCPIGEYILREAQNEHVSFILPPTHSKIDMENFKLAFPVRGNVLIADSELNDYYESFCRCYKKHGKNVIIEIGARGKIKLFKVAG